MRLARLLSKWNVASRTGAEALVRAGAVVVDGYVVRDPELEVDPASARLVVEGRAVSAPAPDSFVVLAYNKPRGELSTTRDPEGRRTVMEAFAALDVPGLAPVGRLDRASAGLLLLTNDGALADALTDPRSHVAKSYRVKIRGHLDWAELSDLRAGTLVEDGLELGPMQVEIERGSRGSEWLAITLREGKNRQIRRRLQALGKDIEHLVRVAIGPLALGDLGKGEQRPLTAVEVEALRGAVGAQP